MVLIATRSVYLIEWTWIVVSEQDSYVPYVYLYLNNWLELVASTSVVLPFTLNKMILLQSRADVFVVYICLLGGMMYNYY